MDGLISIGERKKRGNPIHMINFEGMISDKILSMKSTRGHLSTSCPSYNGR